MKKLFILITLFSCIFFTSCKYSSKENRETKIESRTVPAIEDVVIYEIFVRNFTTEGTFNAIIPQLNRIKSLGANVIWLMPIQPIGKINHKGTFGSPYSIANYTETNPDFGTKKDFKALVDSVHAKGMYIIIDEVANHTAWDNPWIKEHPDWYTHDSTGKIIPPKGTDWNDVADLNYDNRNLRTAKINALKYWIDSFNIDGYRCDAAMMVPDDFWQQAIDSLRKIRPILMLCEDEDSSDYSIDGFEMNYGWGLYSALKKTFAGGKVTAVDSALKKEQAKFPSNYHALRFITNHDEDSWDNVPEVKFINRDGAKAAFVAMATMPGVPLIYNGQEVGYATKINLFEKYTIDWSANPDLQKWYSTLLNFRNGNEVLKKGTLDQFDLDNENVLIYQRKLLGTDPLWVIVNTRNEEVTAKLPAALQNKKLRDVISSEGIASSDVMKLRPYEYHILKAE